MIALALTVALSLPLGGADSLTKQTLQGLTFKGPSQWVKTQPDENTLKWEDAEADASLALSAYVNETPGPAKVFVGKMVDALGKEGFAALTVGGQPASKKITTDYLGAEDAEKNEDNKVTTTTVVGCNGKLRWVLTWTSKTSQGPRFGPMLKRVMDSISYRK